MADSPNFKGIGSAGSAEIYGVRGGAERASIAGGDVEVGLETMTTGTLLNGCDVVPPMATDGSLGLDGPCIGPSSESWLCDSKSNGCVLSPQPLVIVVHQSLIYECDLDQLQVLIAKTSECLDFALRSRSMTLYLRRFMFWEFGDLDQQL